LPRPDHVAPQSHNKVAALYAGLGQGQ